MRNLLAVLLSLAVPCFLMCGCVGAPIWGDNFWDIFAPILDGQGPGNPSDGDDDNVDPSDGDNVTPGGDGQGKLTPVKTSIPLRFDAGLECGDDLIAFGTDVLVGVSYVIPSQNPTAGTPVPDSDQYDCCNFDVAGRWIFMAGSNGGSLPYQVSAFNVDTLEVTTFDAADIRLVKMVVKPRDAGRLQASGDYCVVVCDQDKVDDGKIIKVIDVSSGTPELITFEQNPVDYASVVTQVAVNGTTKTVAVAAEEALWIYDITQPTAAPRKIIPPNGVGKYQMKMSGNYLIASSYDGGYDTAILVDLAANNVVTMEQAETIADLAIGGDKFAFFSHHDSDDSVGLHFRTAVGTLPGPTFNKPPTDNYIDGSYTSNGVVGYAGTMCMTPGGEYLFLANFYLQYSQGNASFTVPKDPANADTYGCPAWDIDCSDNTVGFHSAASRSSREEGVLGYIILE